MSDVGWEVQEILGLKGLGMFLLGNWGILGIGALRIVLSCESKDSGSLRPWKDCLLAEYRDFSLKEVRIIGVWGPEDYGSTDF